MGSITSRGKYRPGNRADTSGVWAKADDRVERDIPEEQDHWLDREPTGGFFLRVLQWRGRTVLRSLKHYQVLRDIEGF